MFVLFKAASGIEMLVNSTLVRSAEPRVGEEETHTVLTLLTNSDRTPASVLHVAHPLREVQAMLNGPVDPLRPIAQAYGTDPMRYHSHDLARLRLKSETPYVPATPHAVISEATLDSNCVFEVIEAGVLPRVRYSQGHCGEVAAEKGWYFWDETGGLGGGPYPSQKEADAAATLYAQHLHGEELRG